MCFSAEASFAAALFLAPCGVVTVGRALAYDKRLLGFACFPLFFGIQQVTEGIVWLGVATPSVGPVTSTALIFLFFAYWFWPVWVPASA